MRNQRNTYIPAPKAAPKPPSRVLALRKTSSSQTERVVLIKEENLTFHPFSRFSQNDGGMRRDYAKAVNYINSCHKFINSIVEKNSDNKTNMFVLPMVTNFVPIFGHLIGKKAPKRREKRTEVEVKMGSKSEERKSKSSFAVKNEEETPIDPAPVGDCGKTQEDAYAAQVADIVRDQVQKFLNTLQNDMDKAAKRSKSETPKPQCKNLDIVKQRLEQLTNICCLRKNIESSPQILQMAFTPPTPPSFKCLSERSSVILEEKEPKKNSTSSILSESSDIKTDSDLEIN